MLTIFQPQLTSIDSELLTLQQRLTELENLKNDLQAKQAKASEALESLKAIASGLAGEAIQNLKAAVLGIFGEEASENGSNTPQTEIFADFVTEVPKMPTEEEIFDAECLPPAQPETIPPGSLITIDTGDGGSVSWVVPEQPKSEPYLEFVHIRENSTVGYFRKSATGEIGSAYLGCSSHRLANEWVKLLNLWGADVQAIRLAKRLQAEGVKYEVKFTGCGFDRLVKLAETHPTGSTPVPAPKDEPNPSEADTPQPQPSNESEISKKPSEKLIETPTSQESQNNPDTSNLPSFEFYVPSDSSALAPEWDAYHQGKLLGRVKQHLTKADTYQHSLLRGGEWQKIYFPSRELAATDLLKRRTAEDTLHDRANKQLQTAYGF